MKNLLRHGHLMLAATVLAFTGLAIEPVLAQQASARWKPGVESITVRAGAMKNWYAALTASHVGKAFMVSASIPVPYSDLDLGKEQDATEFGRRIQVASQLVCEALDSKYPPAQYPILEGSSGYDCVRAAARDGMDQVSAILASAKH